jgi:hypothetical protein
MNPHDTAMPTATPDSWHRARELADRLAVPFLLALFTGLACTSLMGDSATFDETAYVASGITHLECGDYRLNQEVPPLAPMICMAPLHLFGKPKVDYESSAWKESLPYKVGYEILNGPVDDEERRNPRGTLVAGRLPMVALGVMLGLILYAWTKEMWGRREALATLFLYALSPTVLAHTRLITMDLPAALGFLGTLWAFWRFCRRPGWARAAALGIALGLALLMKHSMVTLVPILGILLTLWVADAGRGTGEWKVRLLKGTAALTLAAVVAAHAIWLAYRYQYPASMDPAVSTNWNLPGMKGLLGSLFGLARDHRLLPEAYLYGVVWQFARAAHPVFLNGGMSDTGWWYYFPEAFLLKTTPSVLFLGALAVGVAVRQRALDMNAWFLLLPCLYLFYMTSARGLNIGHRYLTPIYPPLFMAAGLCVRALDGPRWKAWAVATLFAGHALSSFTTFPRYLSYFNVFAGGAAHGWRYLVDSNIDWGQDLPRLKSWMDGAEVRRVHLAYFGTGDPKAYGIEFEKLQLLDWLPPQKFRLPPKGDYVAVSVTLLQGLHLREGPIRGYLDKVRTCWTPVAKAGDSIFIYRAED